MTPCPLPFHLYPHLFYRDLIPSGGARESRLWRFTNPISTEVFFFLREIFTTSTETIHSGLIVRHHSRLRCHFAGREGSSSSRGEGPRSCNNRILHALHTHTDFPLASSTPSRPIQPHQHWQILHMEQRYPRIFSISTGSRQFQALDRILGSAEAVG